MSEKYLEKFNELSADRKRPKAILFDFDGTISTLRYGWEKVMAPMFVEMICGETEPTPEIEKMVEDYIDESTGIQTAYQMEWLAKTVKEMGLNPVVLDKWDYKDEYNTRLMKSVAVKRDNLIAGKVDREEYLMKGSVEFLEKVKALGIKMYVASGTDHPDVVKEATALGVADYFDSIEGAPLRETSCSKEGVIRALFEKENVDGSELVVFGDGKVEIKLGQEAGGISIGCATDEENRTGVNEVKRQRLIKAGANAIIDDFEDADLILEYIGLA